MCRRSTIALMATMIGVWFIVPATTHAQNFVWGSVNGIPAAPGVVLTDISGNVGTTTNKLYNDGSTLKWNGSAVGGTAAGGPVAGDSQGAARAAVNQEQA